MKKVFILSLILISCAFVLNSQTNNNIYLYPADEMLLRQKVVENPNLIVEYMIYEDNLKALSNKDFTMLKTDTFINGKRVIPVVFHIIHILWS